MPLSCPKSMAAFIRACWAQQSTERPSFTSIHTTLKELAREPEVF
jgi:hypothetical protein